MYHIYKSKSNNHQVTAVKILKNKMYFKFESALQLEVKFRFKTIVYL